VYLWPTERFKKKNNQASIPRDPDAVTVELRRGGLWPSVDWGFIVLLRFSTMAFPAEDEIIAVLNDEWATIAQIRSRLSRKNPSVQISNALAQMANAGKIERKLEKTMAPKANSKLRQLSFYRQCAK
jgi:hypothetical protein